MFKFIRSISYICCLFLLISIFSHTTFAQTPTNPPQSSLENTDQFQIYESLNLGIRIQYPLDWSANVDIPNNSIAFYDPAAPGTDLDIEKRTAFKNMTLEQYSKYDINKEFSSARCDGDRSASFLMTCESDLAILTSNMTTIGDNRAYQVVFTSISRMEGGAPCHPDPLDFCLPPFSNETPQKTMKIYLINQDTLYVFTYRTGTSYFEKYMPIIHRIINSFEIIK